MYCSANFFSFWLLHSLRQKKAEASKTHRYYLEHQRTRGTVSKNIAADLHLHSSAELSCEYRNSFFSNHWHVKEALWAALAAVLSVRWVCSPAWLMRCFVCRWLCSESSSFLKVSAVESICKGKFWHPHEVQPYGYKGKPCSFLRWLCSWEKFSFAETCSTLRVSPKLVASLIRIPLYNAPTF